MIYLFLIIATLAVFWQVNNGGFIFFDDPQYVTENNHVQNGVTLEGVRWAITTGYFGNWHPLTWLSHMLDIQLFGLEPRWHHLTNLLFHIANTLLLFFVLYRMTKAHWESAFVAALFALHPLHVESVAWVSERKDVLSTFFWILTMGAYCYYVERPKLQRYLIVVAFFGLGLLAKPMLVTLPFVLLLLDYWPLQRFQQKMRDLKIGITIGKPVSGDKQKGKSKRKPAAEEAVIAEKTADVQYHWALVRPLLWEKIPLIALAAASSIVTYLVQQKGGMVKSFEMFPLSVRISNAFVSYVTYIGKTIWPNNLAAIYTHPGSLPTWQVIGAALILIAVTIAVIWKARRIPYLAVGWLWYAGTLVPVIGLVQVGLQARADRYTYLPLIGLFIMATWGISELSKSWRYRKEALTAVSTVILIGLCIVTWTQIRFWQNSITLLDHALRVTHDNYIAYYNRGLTNEHLGNYKQAIMDYDKSIEINPKFHVRAYYNRGHAYTILGNYQQAIADYDKAIEIYPEYDEAYFNRGCVYAILGNNKQAIDDYDKAIEINPNKADPYVNRGNAYARLDNYQQAIGDYNKAIETNPQYGEAYFIRGHAYWQLGNKQQAMDDLKAAARLGQKDAQGLLKSQGIRW